MNPTRREFLRLTGLAAATGLAAKHGWAAKTPAGKGRKPNILFFFPDQHRYDWTSLNPVMPDLTPNLKKLAARGAQFSNAIVPSPLCAPCRGCLASGKEYQRAGVPGNNNNYPIEETSFYTLLEKAGYHTLGCGKFDLAKPMHSWGPDGKQKLPDGGSRLTQWGFTDGIDNAGKMDGWNGHQHHKDGPYFTYLESKKLVDAYKKNYRLLDHDYDGQAVLADEDYGDNWIARNGLALIRSVPEGEPWFIQINFNGPHNPMDITKSMYLKWKDTKFPPAVEGDGSDTTEKKRRNYGAMINNIDAWLGTFLEEVEKRGELDNTVVVYCSDHGDMLGDHQMWAKNRPLHPSAAVPLVIAGPGVKSGVTCGNPVETLDLVATFLDFAGVKVPSDMDAQSMRPFLAGTGELPRAFARSSLGGWTMVFDGRYKLAAGNLKGKVPKRDDAKEMVLYDLKTDPGETKDVAAENPKVVARLKPLLATIPEPREKGKKKRARK